MIKHKEKLREFTDRLRTIAEKKDEEELKNLLQEMIDYKNKWFGGDSDKILNLAIEYINSTLWILHIGKKLNEKRENSSGL